MNLSFLFGALCPKFSEQLKDQGYELKKQRKMGQGCFFSCVFTHSRYFNRFKI